MSRPLSGTTLNDFIPASIAGDSQMQAATQSVQPYLDEINSLIPTIELYRLIDHLPEPMLHLLAWENKMDGVEWRLAITLEDKRNLVKNSFELNKRRGTLWSVERVFELLRLRAEIVEWWEEGGPPATFRIAVLDVSGRGIEAYEIELIDELIAIYKPLTRHITGVNMNLTAARVDAKAASGLTVTATLEILPINPTELIEFDLPIVLGGVPQTGITIEI